MFNNNHNKNDNAIRPIPMKIFDSENEFWFMKRKVFNFTFIAEGMDFPLYWRKEIVECRDG